MLDFVRCPPASLSDAAARQAAAEGGRPSYQCLCQSRCAGDLAGGCAQELSFPQCSELCSCRVHTQQLGKCRLHSHLDFSSRNQLRYWLLESHRLAAATSASPVSSHIHNPCELFNPFFIICMAAGRIPAGYLPELRGVC